MRKRIASIATAAILALSSVAAVGGWARSLRTLDMVTRDEARVTAAAVRERTWSLASHDGRLQLRTLDRETPAFLFGDPARHNRTAWRWHTLPATGRTAIGAFNASPTGRLGFGYAATHGPIGPGQSSRETVVSIPYWALVAGLALPTGLALRSVLHARRARTRVRRGHCPGCGYDLRETPHACPECGRLTPPAPTATF